MRCPLEPIGCLCNCVCSLCKRCCSGRKASFIINVTLMPIVTAAFAAWILLLLRPMSNMSDGHLAFYITTTVCNAWLLILYVVVWSRACDRSGRCCTMRPCQVFDKVLWILMFAVGGILPQWTVFGLQFVHRLNWVFGSFVAQGLMFFHTGLHVAVIIFGYLIPKCKKSAGQGVLHDGGNPGTSPGDAEAQDHQNEDENPPRANEEAVVHKPPDDMMLVEAAKA